MQIAARLVLLWLLAALSQIAWGQPSVKPSAEDVQRFLASIELHTAAELAEAMQRAEHLHLEARADGRMLEPIAFVLHGPEVISLLAPNYEKNMKLVDMAERLVASEYIDLKVCQRWMGGNGIDPAQLPPFIGTVPYGAAEIERLMTQDYVYF